jgi:hypothetical protein
VSLRIQALALEVASLLLRLQRLCGVRPGLWPYKPLPTIGRTSLWRRPIWLYTRWLLSDTSLFIISLEGGGSWGFEMTVCLRQGAFVAVPATKLFGSLLVMHSRSGGPCF